jgi:mannose-6-phosphate isomerase-like protein (cupin superfamily)
MTHVIARGELPIDGTARELEGYRYGDTRISCIFVEAPPGGGPKLHSHPYEEVFIIQEGQVTFTVGSDTIEAGAGQIVIAPAHLPHRFVNTGTTTLRQIDIHVSPRFITTWYDERDADGES